jgi:hypothetical protein
VAAATPVQQQQRQQQQPGAVPKGQPAAE